MKLADAASWYCRRATSFGGAQMLQQTRCPAASSSCRCRFSLHAQSNNLLINCNVDAHRPFPSLDPDHPSFPSPKWAPNYNLTESTALQPGAGQMTRGGLFEPKHPWGLITLGSDYESTAATVANCRSLKAAGNAAKCFIYHNWERALGWIES